MQASMTEVQFTKFLTFQSQNEIHYSALVWNSRMHLASYSTKSPNPSLLQYKTTCLGDQPSGFESVKRQARFSMTHHQQSFRCTQKLVNPNLLQSTLTIIPIFHTTQPMLLGRNGK
jgi:hypothetical protein